MEDSMIRGFSTYCVCPQCRGELAEFTDTLYCDACKKSYEIQGGIPILLPEYKEDKDLRERYLQNYNKIAEDDLEKPLVQGRHNLLHNTLINFIGDVRDCTVLDVGSSNGLYLKQLNAKLKVAADLALPYLNNVLLYTNIIPICCDAEYLPVKLKLFDVIIISDIIEHLLHPEYLVNLLSQECQPHTRIIVHIPWEESLEQYKGCAYDFVHLRSFTTYSFRLLFWSFYVTREKSSLPLMSDPIIFQLGRFLPKKLFNLLVYTYFMTDLKHIEYTYRAKWIEEIPKKERWLLWFYKPQVKMFELRRHKYQYRYLSTLSPMIARWWGKISSAKERETAL
jgi:uncharacterized protein YbaR (Trm112 family)